VDGSPDDNRKGKAKLEAIDPNEVSGPVDTGARKADVEEEGPDLGDPAQWKRMPVRKGDHDEQGAGG
jgi:hypothetical protein